MRILEGLDTETQQPYTFTRHILGPFVGKVLPPNSDEGDREVLIREAYRHVFGNAYIMEEERKELAVPESQFKCGNLSMKEFVRALAKSSAYTTRFFEGASSYRYTELNYMHLLGRAPDDHSEVASHMVAYQKCGFGAAIDQLIDSDEYESVFGDDTTPFLRFRGAYTPCDSFNKQCALKGGWANSDKAMGGAAQSGWNGQDGRQMSDLISAYAIPSAATPYEFVADNTPLKSTAPNWYACPDPALAPTPAFVSAIEVKALSDNVSALEAQYAAAIAKRNAAGKDPLATFRAMTRDMSAMLERGPAYSGGDPLLANPFSRQMGSDDSPLTTGGCKSSSYESYGAAMENDTVSRLERDLEVAKSQLRVLSKALKKSTPMSGTLLLPGQVSSQIVSANVTADAGTLRPRIKLNAAKKTSAAAAAASAAASVQKVPSSGPTLGGQKIGPITIPTVTLPGLPSLPKLPAKPTLPSMPSLPKISLPFGKKK
jgi:Phycobilisome Linker polypeptide